MARSRNIGCLGLVALLVVGWLLLRMCVGGPGPAAPAVPAPSDAPAPVEQPADAGDPGAANHALAPLEPLDEEDAAPADDASAVDAPAVEAAAGRDVASDSEVGEAEVNGVNWTILEAVEVGESLESDDSSVDSVVAKGALVGVRFTIENDTPDPLTFVGMPLTDDQGRAYDYLSAALPFIEDVEACDIVTIDPGDSVTCTAIYDVATDVTALNAVVTDLNMLGGDEAQIALELE